MSLGLRAWAGLVFILAASGCSDPAPPPISFDEYTKQVADAECTFAVRCSGTPDFATCKATTYQLDSDLTRAAYVHDGRLDFDPAQAQKCIDFWETTNCDGEFGIDVSAWHRACDGAVIGHAPTNGDCIIGDECPEGDRCVHLNCQDRCCLGVCMQSGKSPVGGNCNNASCVDGAYCSSGTCLPRAPERGATCHHPSECAYPLICELDSPGSAGTCQPRAEEGESCDAGLSYHPCAHNIDYCDPTSNTCVRRAAVGEACDPTAFEGCVWYAYCDAGTCKAEPVEGEACAPTSGPGTVCQGAYLACTNGVCVAPPDPMVCE